MLHGLEAEVADIRSDAEARDLAAREAHGHVEAALEASIRLGEADREAVAAVKVEQAQYLAK